MTEPTDAEIFDAADDFRSQYKHGGTTFDEFDALGFARAVLQRWGQPAGAGEPLALLVRKNSWRDGQWEAAPPNSPSYGLAWANQRVYVYTTPQPTQAQAVAVPLTDREIELIDGMIQVQLDHASRCDAIANRSIADKQKGWDMERVALLQKLKMQGTKGST